MIKLLLKLGASSGIITGTWLTDFSMSDIFTTRKDKTQLEKIKPNLERITSIEDIKMLEKTYGCTFSFVQGWDSKKVYTVEKFLKEEKSTNSPHGSWKENAIKGVDLWKDKCKTERVVAMFNGPVKGFAFDTSKFK